MRRAVEAGTGVLNTLLGKPEWVGGKVARFAKRSSSPESSPTRTPTPQSRMHQRPCTLVLTAWLRLCSPCGRPSDTNQWQASGWGLPDTRWPLPREAALWGRTGGLHPGLASLGLPRREQGSRGAGSQPSLLLLRQARPSPWPAPASPASDLSFISQAAVATAQVSAQEGEAQVSPLPQQAMGSQECGH